MGDGELGNMLSAINYQRGKLEIINQLRLPENISYEPVRSVEDAWVAIRLMKVRGAPAIAIVGMLALAVELIESRPSTLEDLTTFVESKLDRLTAARPTAVNMASMAGLVRVHLQTLLVQEVSADEIRSSIIELCEQTLESDRRANFQIGKNGSNHILSHAPPGDLVVMTICNTGSLATSGYGTALGVIRSLASSGCLSRVYFLETRPYNQGSRLTAVELLHDSIPATLIPDSAAAITMATKGVAAVVVGADRVAANGDTANKIGTYMLAVCAKHHGIPFYVAAPTTSIDLSRADGKSIIIEERPAEELTFIQGVPIAPAGVDCWNPAFDITPAVLITGGIITEVGTFQPSQLAYALGPHTGSPR